MQYTAVLLSALATLSLATPLVPRQGSSIKVGQGSDQGILIESALNQDLTFVITDFDQLSGSAGTASGISSAFVSSDDVFASSNGQFSETSCDFFTDRDVNDADGNIQCDVNTFFQTVSSSDSAIDFNGIFATCFFCRVAPAGQALGDGSS